MNERLTKILEILEREKYCTTEYLANTLYVVPATIRRDLKKLEQQGLVIRNYGGASIISHDNRNVPYVVRQNSNNSIKASLAKEALKLIPDGSTIFLDASTTVSYIAELLSPKQNLTVITSSIKVASILSQKNIKTYCTGGRLINSSHSLVGTLAASSIAALSADIFFFSSQGVELNGNITDFSESETQVRKSMIARAKKSYFVGDSSKIGKEFLFSVCNVKNITGIICDKDIKFHLDK
ncbi:MAG: DeoR/GlpR transcriptional regulator [Tyzzerella sp.]|nr:DeoR/GlpR transcriptional regulator [Tyzzerella sp.]